MVIVKNSGLASFTDFGGVAEIGFLLLLPRGVNVSSSVLLRRSSQLITGDGVIVIADGVDLRSGDVCISDLNDVPVLTVSLMMFLKSLWPLELYTQRTYT
jgi:hypothetical protein